MPSCHRFLSVGTFNKEAFINLGMRFSMGDIRPPHNQNAQDLSRWVVCLLVTQKNEQLQKSDEISFQLKIYNEATWWKHQFSLCELFFLLGFFLMFLNPWKNAVVYNVWKKNCFVNEILKTWYYSFVDQVIKCPICKAILEDGHILRAFAGLFPGKISGTYLAKVAPITTQLNLSQIGSNPANIEHEKSLKSPIHTFFKNCFKNCQMDEEIVWIYIYIHMFMY